MDTTETSSFFPDAIDELEAEQKQHKSNKKSFFKPKDKSIIICN